MEELPKKRIENTRSPESEDDERLKAFMEMHPELFPDPGSIELRDSGPEVAELEGMFTKFKEKYSLEGLNAITYLDYREASNHPLREPARIFLSLIYKKFKQIKNETSISEDKLNELMVKKEELSRAVGIINGKGEVDHTRGF